MTAPRRWREDDAGAPPLARELLLTARRAQPLDGAARELATRRVEALRFEALARPHWVLPSAAAAVVLALAGGLLLLRPFERPRTPAATINSIEMEPLPAPVPSPRPDRSAEPEAPAPAAVDVPERRPFEAVPDQDDEGRGEKVRPRARSAVQHVPVIEGRSVEAVAPQVQEAPPTDERPASVQLGAEARGLEDARERLRNDPAASLRLLDSHAARFPAGQLSAEREIIAIDALRRLGRYDEARARAEAALRRWPDGLYRGRVLRLLHQIP